MEYEIVSGKRRDSKLLYTIGEKQLYLKKSLYKNKVFYKCYFENCKSRICVTDGVCSKCGDFAEHNHSDQKALYEELKVLNNIKRKCAETRGSGEVNNTLSGIRESFKSVCDSNQEASKNLDFSKIQRTLQNLTNTVYMTPPKTPADVKEAFEKKDIFNNLGISRYKREERAAFFKICYEEQEFAYCVFISQKSIQMIEDLIPINSNRKILIDDTFAPLALECFQQLLVISINYRDRVFPFVFILMKSKVVKCYIHLFKYLTENIIDLNGATFISGYETNLRKAINLVYPFSKTFESWFHYWQFLRLYISIKFKDLAAFLKENKEASLQFHKILALPFLPRCYIYSTFHIIRKEIENCDYHLKFIPFMQYFQAQWLEKLGPEGTSIFGLTTRTTMALKAYNDFIRKMIQKHKNFFKFIQFLQNEEYTKSREMEMLVTGGSDKASDSSKCKNLSIALECSEKAAKIEKTASELLKGYITAVTFLNQMVLSENHICTNMEPEEIEDKDLSLVKDEINDTEEAKTVVEQDANRFEDTIDLESKPFITCLVDVPNRLQFAYKNMEICKECILKVQRNSMAKKVKRFNCQACFQPLDDTIPNFL